MVRENRIKFTVSDDISITDLTATAGGVIDVVTPNGINGFIQNISWLAGNHTATGSLFITVSGTGEEILTLTSGATTGNVAANFVKYPRAEAHGLTGIPLSGANGYDEFVEIPVATKIRIVGSGLGNGTSGLGVSITYV